MTFMGAASMYGAFMAKSEIVKGCLLYVAAMTLFVAEMGGSTPRRGMSKSVVGTLLRMGSQRDVCSGDAAGIFRAASLGLAVPEMFQATEGASHLSACSGAHSSFHIFRRQLPYPGTAFLRLTM